MKRFLLLIYLLALIVSCGIHEATVEETQTPEQVKQELAQMGRRLVVAIQRKDFETMKQAWAAEYLSTGPNGMTATREQLMGAIEKNLIDLDSLDIDDLYVRVWGNMAVLTGHANAKVKVNGEDFSGAYRATGVYIKRDGHWEALGLQVTPENWKKGGNCQ